MRKNNNNKMMDIAMIAKDMAHTKRTSKTNYIAIVNKLLDYLNSENWNGYSFTASDVGLAGSQLYWLVNYYHVLRVIGTNEYWYEVDEDTMKKATVNVYNLEEGVTIGDINSILINTKKEMRTFFEEEKAILIEKIEEINSLIKAYE